MRLRFVLPLGLLAALASCSEPEPPTTPLARTPAPPPADRPETDAATAALLRETSTLHREGRLQEGIVRLEEELRRDPERPRLHYNLGVFRASSGEFEAAATAFEDELARFPGHAESHRALATAYTRLGRIEDSVAHFESCLGSLPDDPICTLGLGRNLSALGLFEDAVHYLERAAEQRSDAEAYAELAAVYRRLGDLERAASSFGKALADDPGHLQTLLGYGQTLTALGRAEDGGALLKRHQRFAALQDQLDAFERGRQQRQPTVEMFLDIARLHFEREDRAAAAASYEEAMGLEPDNPVPALELASLYLGDDRLGDAERCVEQALAADPENPGPRFYHGLVKLKSGDRQAAERAFAGSLERGGWPPAAFLDVGDAFRDAGDLNRAGSAYLEAMRLEPGNPRVHYALALATREHGDRAAAEQAVRQAVEIAPEHGGAWTLLGVLRMEAGDTAGAEKAFLKARDAERLILLRADGIDEVLEDFPGNGDARRAFRRLLDESPSS